MRAGEEEHTRGQDSLWKSQSEQQRTEINRECTSEVWPTLRSRIAKEQNGFKNFLWTSNASIIATKRPNYYNTGTM